MRPKNILFIIVDQVIASSLEIYGGICKTPNLRKLADNGVVFDRAYTTVSLCSPARASIFSGKYPHRHEILYNVTEEGYGRAELKEEEKLIPHYLKANGYVCGYYGKWHIGIKKGPVDYGFIGTKFPGYGIPTQFVEEYDEYLKEKGFGGMNKVSIRDIIASKPCDRLYFPLDTKIGELFVYAGVIDVPLELTPAGFVTQRAIEFLKDSKNRPFFLTVSYWGPHHPALPTKEFVNSNPLSEIKQWENYQDSLEHKPRIQRRYRDSLHKNIKGDWSLWQRIIGAHFDFMTMIDYHLGKLIETLKSLGLYEDTVIIFTSDHGDTLGVHGQQWDKGPYMYEETYRVPLIVFSPEFSPRRCDCLASNMDIFATILDIAGSKVPCEIDSISLIPILNKEKESVRDFILAQFHGFDKRGLYLQRMLIKDNFKYIYNPSDIDELYDLNVDPYELNNLLCTQPNDYKETIRELRSTLYREMVRIKDPFGEYGYELMDLDS